MENLNKKGQIGIIMFFGLLFLILIVGFIVAMVIGIVDFASDEITPIMEELGVLEGTSTNMSEISGYTFGNVDVIIQNLNWLVGIVYIAALLFSIIFALVGFDNPSPFFMGLYFALILLLILGSVFISNAYEDILKGNDEISTRLYEQTIMTYMILHSPAILTLV
ncbi:MAG: hypothetical protein KAI70_08355, partial [Candidatus Omnitrophica bacterium]|nr:hypothetical protein [Candidatus Omnitrophota bacterium]